MPYKDPSKQREYQRRWMACQRAQFFAGKSCVDCGSTEELELDHVNGEKVSHRIWSWAPAKRAAEIAKCVVRCRDCHIERHASERRQDHGEGAYRNRGCRCVICRAAHAASARRYLERKRAA